MGAEIKFAAEHGPGHAWLVTPAPLPPDAAIAVVNEAETNRHLGPNGWQSVPHALVPDRIEAWNGGSRALLPPGIVDRIKDAEHVTITRGGEEIFAGFWPPIPPAGGKGQGRGVVGMAAATPAPAAFVPAMPPSMLEAPVEPPASAPPQPGRPAGRRWPAFAIAAVLVLVFAGIGGAAFLQRDRLASAFEDALGTARPYLSDWLPADWLPEPAVASLVPAQPARAPPAPAPATPTPTPETGDFGLGAEGWRRLVIDPATDPARLYTLGRMLRERPDGDRDLGFQALYAAVQRGNRAALAWYGRANDPTVAQDPTESIEAPNVRRALESYRAAASAGDAETGGALSRLCDHLRPRRFSGTPIERTGFQDFCR